MYQYLPSSKPNTRIDVADVLRGIAIGGIVLIHFIEHLNFYNFPDAPTPLWEAVNKIVWDTTFFLLAGKMYAIFALLFGLSFYIQHDNQAQKGEDFRLRFAWRMVLLMLFGLFDLFHFKDHQPVVEKDLVPGVHLFADALIGYGDARLVALDLLGRESERISFLQKDFAVPKGLDAEFRTFCIKQDGKRNIFLLAHLFDRCNFFRMIFICSVREIDARDIHSGIRHGADDFFGLGRRSQRADDLGLFHTISSMQNISILFYHIFRKKQAFFKILCYNITASSGLRGRGAS